MFFSRTYRYQSQMQVDDIKSRLLGQHVKVHNLDFEVSENEQHIKVVPHAEQVTAIKTLPITHIELKGKGDKTHVVISSKMRKIDSGGPMLIVIFCIFMLIAAIVLFYLNEDPTFAYIFGGLSIAIFSIFWFRMEAGYFDYVRKIRDYIKKQSVA